MAYRVAEAGMDPMRYLESTDSLVIHVMQHIADEFQVRKKEDMENLAVLIINQLARAMKRA
jgi:hypothetical protein